MLQVRESGLLSLSNGLESFSVSAPVQQRRNEEEHHPVEISCFVDSFKVMETHGFEASFCSSVP